MSIDPAGSTLVLGLNASASLASFSKKPKLDIEREHGINFNLEEMKDFFMKHYNDSSSYNDKL